MNPRFLPYPGEKLRGNFQIFEKQGDHVAQLPLIIYFYYQPQHSSHMTSFSGRVFLPNFSLEKVRCFVTDDDLILQSRQKTSDGIQQYV